MAANPERAESRPASTGDGSKAGGLAKTSAEPPQNPAARLFSVAGKVKAISAASLTLETKANEYTYDLTGAVIKIGVRDATAADLGGDEIRVSYTRTEDKLVARTVSRVVKRAT
jgi:hypothetical protein